MKSLFEWYLASRPSLQDILLSNHEMKYIFWLSFSEISNINHILALIAFEDHDPKFEEKMIDMFESTLTT